jgi:hypothetical protein
MFIHVVHFIKLVAVIADVDTRKWMRLTISRNRTCRFPNFDKYLPNLSILRLISLNTPAGPGSSDAYNFNQAPSETG